VGYRHEFNAMTGLKRDACHWLAYRSSDRSPAVDPQNGQSFVGFTTNTRLTSSLLHNGWMTGLYQTASKVWVSEATGRVFMNPTLGLSARWQTFELDGVLRGIWGLSDDCVFAWGMHAKAPVAYHYDGTEWRSVASPGYVVGMHGMAPDQVFAVGQKGLVARWNGVDGFDAVTSPARGTLSDVAVVSGDEIYACGADGELVRGTAQGWESVLRHSAPMRCVAAWGGRVWVGADDGLHCLRDGALEVIKPKLRPIRFDARGELLITQPTDLVSTKDGESFTGIPVIGFVRLSAGAPAPR
jgi:hypothetical protein